MIHFLVGGNLLRLLVKKVFDLTGELICFNGFSQEAVDVEPDGGAFLAMVVDPCIAGDHVFDQQHVKLTVAGVLAEFPGHFLHADFL